MDEFSLIQRLTRQGISFRSQIHPDVVTGIGDDAAVVNISPGKQWLLSCDTMVEGVHFTSKTMTESDIGFKALAVNISDIAAMGGVPRFVTVSITVPASVDQGRLMQLYEGLYACAEHFQVAIVGGDTTSSKHDLMISMQIIGEVDQGKAILRSGAQAGDAVFVTGWPGCSAAGLHALLHQQHQRGTGNSVEESSCDFIPSERLIKAHQRPMPSVEAGRLLVQSGVCHALNDISDGTASEAWEIAEASNIGIVLYEEPLPLHPEMVRYAKQSGIDPLHWFLYGGEDYALIGTAMKAGVHTLKQSFAARQIPFFVVGQADVSFRGVRLIRKDSSVDTILKQGYNHFR